MQNLSFLKKRIDFLKNLISFEIAKAGKFVVEYVWKNDFNF